MTPPAKESKMPDAEAEQAPTYHVAPSPHLSDTSLTTRGMMLDVLIALIPAFIVALIVFRQYAAIQVAICVVSCLVAEAVFTRMRGKPMTRLLDGSAALTGVILALSLPWSAPPYVGVIGSFVAIGLGKAVFGGLGCNVFNPAMVGRAFAMLSFAKALGAPAYQDPGATIDAVTRPTPLTAAKAALANLAASDGLREAARELSAALFAPEGALNLKALFIGNVNGSLGETSALALLIGGIYLCWRRTASWEIPVGVIVSAALFGGLANALSLSPIGAAQHVLAGALLFGAFFIATDPVTSPLTPKGKFIFGAGVGAFVILLRLFSSYPEGVMFAVLLMNGATPLINSWTIPRPIGGHGRPSAA